MLPVDFSTNSGLKCITCRVGPNAIKIQQPNSIPIPTHHFRTVLPKQKDWYPCHQRKQHGGFLRGTPSYHPYFNGIFQYKPFIVGYPMAWETTSVGSVRRNLLAPWTLHRQRQKVPATGRIGDEMGKTHGNVWKNPCGGSFFQMISDLRKMMS